VAGPSESSASVLCRDADIAALGYRYIDALTFRDVRQRRRIGYGDLSLRYFNKLV